MTVGHRGEAKFKKLEEELICDDDGVPLLIQHIHLYFDDIGQIESSSVTLFNGDMVRIPSSDLKITILDRKRLKQEYIHARIERIVLDNYQEVKP